MSAHPAAIEPLVSQFSADPIRHRLADALFGGALPDEVAGLSPEEAARVVDFVAAAAAERPAGEPVVRLESLEGQPGRRRMALAIVNDDMPFLVDSVSAAIGAENLAIDRLLHPIIEAQRDTGGKLTGIAAGSEGPRESLIYMELERIGARGRAELIETLQSVLADVRAAVDDWPEMLGELRRAATALAATAAGDGEAAAFLEWLSQDNFTLLGFHEYRFDQAATDASFDPVSERGLGLLRGDVAIWKGAQGFESIPDGMRRFFAGDEPVLITKASILSTVHRRAYFDYVGVKQFDAAGKVVGEKRFVGLFTSQALNAPPHTVPMIRRKVEAVNARLRFDARSHAGKALTHVLESLPKDELFQLDAERLADIAQGLLSLLDRPRPKLFVRQDPFQRFVSALVFVPRDAYTSGVREAVGDMLAKAFNGKLSRYDVELRAEGLARVHYILATTPGSVPAIDEAVLDARLTSLVRGWGDSLEAALAGQAGATRAARLALSHGTAFTAVYQAQFGADDAATDVLRLTTLENEAGREVYFYRRSDDGAHQVRVKIYRLGQIIPLSDAVPVLENFGLRVIDEFAFDLAGGRLGWIHDFLVETPDHSPIDLEDARLRVEPALRAVLVAEQENDVFNALVLGVGLDARAVGWLRAYFRYLRQTGVAYGLATVVDALRRYPDIARDLVAMFEARFDPATTGDRAAAERKVNVRLQAALANVKAIDDDRILRLYRRTIEATLRTNAFFPGGPEALAFKLESAKVPNLPPPVPYREIWVYSPRIEGIHLRGGPIARGGLRWSDRRDDFRTEVLGLVKAQMVKNAVIVPTGAKGGFYPKQLPSPSDRDAWLAEGTESYRVFIRALLSITDNLDGATVVPPEFVVRHDADDPYLVVAADKGTATFSDVANAISEDQGFWLGDAFASGGRVGYDHKAMGITAKGAWISVQRHFREMGIDVQKDVVRAIGVGDMSGDVFGNGLLLSRSIKLVAAFDHRHIFLDPDPDPETSYVERERMFALPRSSWAEYNPALISKGGGVIPRDQKSIPLTPEVRAMLGLEADELAPAELMQAILKSQADLCWFGGIGTYVKASAESHADVGDRANDAQRVDAEAMRVKVIGEGANLGLTQAARIAFARRGGRINTDFIDNSAGVDCSDNEVNIKIALNPEVAAGRFGLEPRNQLLEAMTDDVAALVLRDNIMQTQAISVAERGGASALPAYIRVIQALEASGRLNRAVEGLPADDLLAQRAQAGQGLERPELAVLLAYAKMALKEALVASIVVDDPVMEGDLHAAFPPVLVERFRDAIDNHRLRRELIATKLANQIINRGGITLPFELAEEMGASLADVATAFVAARELFELRKLWRAIDATDLPAATQMELHLRATDGLRVQMADLLRSTDTKSTPSAIIERLRPGIARIAGQLDGLLRPEPKAQLDRLAQELQRAGAPDDIAAQLLHVQGLDGAVGVAQLAADIGAGENDVVRAYTLLGERLGLDWAKGVAAQLTPSDPWERLLVAGLVRDFEQLRLDLVRRVAASGDPVKATESWLETNRDRADRIASTVARARSGAGVTVPMLAHLGSQARAVLS
ncbi:NAD-glutamate dehydrogenase [Sphingoaurantiacus capsulatus]|uniref:NAD-glutamate dehydrogenase n=1 Tax=Sphingoaurantiacus capsulatus TaxID=1771310 RepID=A0ABV7XGZ3_9SPHN